MVRPSLEDIPDTPLPAGLEVRPALPEHFSAIWHAVEEAYVPEGGPPPTGVLPDDMKNDPNFQPELWQVAWEASSGKVVGSVWTYVPEAMGFSVVLAVISTTAASPKRKRTACCSDCGG
jgi:hypothetical protein